MRAVEGGGAVQCGAVLCSAGGMGGPARRALAGERLRAHMAEGAGGMGWLWPRPSGHSSPAHALHWRNERSVDGHSSLAHALPWNGSPSMEWRNVHSMGGMRTPWAWDGRGWPGPLHCACSHSQGVGPSGSGCACVRRQGLGGLCIHWRAHWPALVLARTGQALRTRRGQVMVS